MNDTDADSEWNDPIEEYGKEYESLAPSAEYVAFIETKRLFELAQQEYIIARHAEAKLKRHARRLEERLREKQNKVAAQSAELERARELEILKEEDRERRRQEQKGPDGFVERTDPSFIQDLDQHGGMHSLNDMSTTSYM